MIRASNRILVTRFPAEEHGPGNRFYRKPNIGSGAQETPMNSRPRRGSFCTLTLALILGAGLIELTTSARQTVARRLIETEEEYEEMKKQL